MARLSEAKANKTRHGKLRRESPAQRDLRPRLDPIGHRLSDRTPQNSPGGTVGKTLGEHLEDALPRLPQSWSHLLQTLPVTETADGMSHLATQLWRQPSVRRLFHSGNWILILSGLSVLVFLDGRLVLATGAGGAMMGLIYLMQDGHWRLPEAQLKQAWETVNQPLVLSVVGGAAAMLGTYLAASIWAEANSPAIATGAVIQGLGTLATLLLLSGNWVSRKASQARVEYHQALNDLTHSDALRRLIAVRQLGQAVADQPQRAAEVGDYFCLLLTRETEPAVRNAALDLLQQIGQAHILQSNILHAEATEPKVNSGDRQAPVQQGQALEAATQVPPPSLNLRPKRQREVIYQDIKNAHKPPL